MGSMSRRIVFFAVGIAMAGLAAACGSSGGSGDNSGPQGTPVQQGSAYVQSRQCGNCHTSDLSGSSSPLPGYPNGVALYAPNLTPDMDTGIGAWNDDELRLAIRSGIDNQGEVLCPQMKHYKDMGDDELNAIIAYLHSIPAVSKQIPGSICPPLKTAQ